MYNFEQIRKSGSQLEEFREHQYVIKIKLIKLIKYKLIHSFIENCISIFFYLLCYDTKLGVLICIHTNSLY